MKKSYSVTEIISNYYESFDSNFWSKYKAFEKLVDKDVFKIEKQKLLTTKKWDDNLLKNNNIDINIFNTEVENLLNKYKEEKDISISKGNIVHNKLEVLIKNNNFDNINFLKLGNNISYKKESKINDNEDCILSEFPIEYNDELFILKGRPDLIIKENNQLIIYDYKTCKKIDDKAYFDNIKKTTKKMFYPLNNIEDTTLNHYMLQLSLYGWMLNKLYQLSIKELYIVHCLDNDIYNLIQVDYKEKECENIIKDLKKKTYIDIELNKNKKIIF